MAKKRGRPSESPNKQYDIVDAAPTECRRCRSIERSAYDSRVEKVILANVFVNQKGRSFNVIEYRNTKCLACGQCRKDKTEILEQN